MCAWIIKLFAGVFRWSYYFQVKSNAPVKFLTFRGTAFQPAKESGGSGKIEKGMYKVPIPFYYSCEQTSVVQLTWIAGILEK